MLRLARLQVAISLAPLIPVSAFSDLETLTFQTGKAGQILGPVTIQADYGASPEIDNPDGNKWPAMEKDSAWTDQTGRHYAYTHEFSASMGSRKGYGSDFVTLDDFGPGKVEYSAGVIFTFPEGDGRLLYSWEGVHMGRLSDAYPHGNPDFISGCPTQGQVFLYDGTGSDNLAEGQWASLLTRKRERPAASNKPVTLPGKETLRIQIGKDDQPLDTVVVWTQYDEPPGIAEPSGRKWADLEKDSAWSDAQGWNLRYSHSFLARKGSREGYGVDYVYLIDNPEDFIGEPRYTSILDLQFIGDTSEYYDWQPEHMADIPQAYPYDKSGFVGEPGRYGEVSIYAGKGGPNLGQGKWARLLSREKGWIGYPQPAALARRPDPGGTDDRWFVNVVPGATLHAPPGAKGLRMIDIQGRVRFEARNLAEGATVALPEDAPRKALRIHWLTGPG